MLCTVDKHWRKHWFHKFKTETSCPLCIHKKWGIQEEDFDRNIIRKFDLQWLHGSGNVLFSFWHISFCRSAKENNQQLELLNRKSIYNDVWVAFWVPLEMMFFNTSFPQDYKTNNLRLLNWKVAKRLFVQTWTSLEPQVCRRVMPCMLKGANWYNSILHVYSEWSFSRKILTWRYFLLKSVKSPKFKK